MSGGLASGTVLRVLIVRHGQSEWNALGRWQGVLRESVPLAPYTHARLGGPARWFAEPYGEEDAAVLVRTCRELELPLYVLGGGSNLLVSDSGVDGVVAVDGIQAAAASVVIEGDMALPVSVKPDRLEIAMPASLTRSNTTVIPVTLTQGWKPSPRIGAIALQANDKFLTAAEAKILCMRDTFWR